MTYSALFCSVVNKNLCLTPLQYEVSTLTRAQRGEARQRAHALTTQPSSVPPELGFLAQKGQIWSHLELGGAGEGRLLYTLIYDFATLR